MLIKFKKKLIDYLLRIRRLLRGDKVVLKKIGNFQMLMGAEHSLPRFLNEKPSYSSNLPRIARILNRKYKDLKIIDVGANIGDSVALVRSELFVPFLCIEGDNTFFKLLLENSKNFADVELVKSFLSDKKEISSVGFIKDQGTLKIDDNKSNSIVPMSTLDEVLEQKQGFRGAKLLKIDTDGYDTKVLRGAMSYISESKPVIFFELDRYLLHEIGESGLEFLISLKEHGYDVVLFYDNVGRFIVSENLENMEAIRQLYLYTYSKQGAFPYYDVAVFHSDDILVANEVVIEEEKINEGTI